VKLGGSTGLYLWLQPDTSKPTDEDPMAITLQKWDLVPVMQIHWQPGVSVIDFMLDLGAKIRDTEHWTGDPGYRPAESLVALSNTLMFGLKAIIDGETDSVSRIFEIVEDGWIVAEDALLHYTAEFQYYIAYRRKNSASSESPSRSAS
jgi:hypothetical protein